MGDFYIAYEYWIAVFQLVTAMLGMGASLTPNDFKEVAREGKAVSLGIAAQLILVPAVAFLFIWQFGLTGGVALGIAVIAAIPGGTTSTIFTLMARGNIALSIAITAVTTIACLLTTPLIMEFLAASDLGDGFVMPRDQVIRDIALTLLLPLGVGMAIRHVSPSFAAPFSSWSIRASLFGIFLIVVGSLSAGRLDAEAFGATNMAIVTGFTFSLMAAAWFASRLAGVSSADRTAIGIEVVVRNINLGVLIKASLFPIVANVRDPIGDMVLFTLLFFGALQLLLAGFIIAERRLLRGRAIGSS